MSFSIKKGVYLFTLLMFSNFSVVTHASDAPVNAIAAPTPPSMTETIPAPEMAEKITSDSTDEKVTAVSNVQSTEPVKEPIAEVAKAQPAEVIKEPAAEAAKGPVAEATDVTNQPVPGVAEELTTEESKAPLAAIAKKSSSEDCQQAAPARVVTPAVNAQPAPVVKDSLLQSEEQKRAYASGVALAQYIHSQMTRQKALHITLDKDILLEGITDTFDQKARMSEQDVQATLAAFDEQVKILTKAAADKKRAEGDAFVAEFAKRNSVKKTSKGLLYIIENKGQGQALKDSDMVEVSYTGTLIDGTVVDSSGAENIHKRYRVANMAPVLRDFVKLIRKGGKVQVVIPPSTLEFQMSGGPDNDLNEVVIYNVSLIEVNPK